MHDSLGGFRPDRKPEGLEKSPTMAGSEWRAFKLAIVRCRANPTAETLAAVERAKVQFVAALSDGGAP